VRHQDAPEEFRPVVPSKLLAMLWSLSSSTSLYGRLIRTALLAALTVVANLVLAEN
jgi:hypothetical protein